MPAPDLAIHSRELLQALFSIELAWLTILFSEDSVLVCIDAIIYKLRAQG